MSHDNTWAEKVQRGRALVTEINDRKWELGDLANEVCPAGANGVHNEAIIGQFAAEIGVSDSALREYRRVSSAWPAATRVAAQTYTTHKILASREDRHELITEQVWTYNSLSDRLGRLPNPTRSAAAEPVPPGATRPLDPRVAITEATPEQKRDIFVALSQSNDVTGDAGTRRAAGRNIEAAAAASDFSLRNARATERDEADRKSRGDLRAIEADVALVKAKRLIREAINTIHDASLSDESRDLLVERFGELARLVALGNDEARGATSVDWDHELASLMGGDN